MSLVVRMFHFETIVSRLDVFVGGDLITRNVDISFDLGLLKLKLASVKSTENSVRTVALLFRIQ